MVGPYSTHFDAYCLGLGLCECAETKGDSGSVQQIVYDFTCVFQSDTNNHTAILLYAADQFAQEHSYNGPLSVPSIVRPTVWCLSDLSACKIWTLVPVRLRRSENYSLVISTQSNIDLLKTTPVGLRAKIKLRAHTRTLIDHHARQIYATLELSTQAFEPSRPLRLIR